MPRFGDLLRRIEWYWWLEDISVRLDWWPGAEFYLYVHVPRLIIMLGVALAISLAATFAEWCYSRLCGDIVIGPS